MARLPAPPIPCVACEAEVAANRARIARALARPREDVRRDVARIHAALEADRQARIAFTEANPGHARRWLLRRSKGEKVLTYQTPKNRSEYASEINRLQITDVSSRTLWEWP